MPLFARKKPVSEPVVEPPVELPVPERTAEEQLATVLDGIEPLRPFGMQINDVSGLTLREDIVSDIDLPIVSTARVAGYGVRAANIVGATELHPIDLRVVGVVERRDTVPSEGVAAGGCVLLAEGAPAPKGVDAVVALADAELTGRVVTFRSEAKLHQNLSVRGSALADGAKLLDADTVLNPRSIALLAEIGLDKVLVRPQPRLVVFSVGDGLVAPGLPLTSISQHYAAATSLVTALARTDGATVYALDIVGRDTSVIRQTIADQVIRADALVVLAETDTDVHLVADLLPEIGQLDRASVRFNGGQPVATGRVGDDRCPVLVLPAGPVTTLAAYHVLVRPLLDRLGARNAAPAPRRTVRLASALRGDEFGPRYVPAALSDARDEARPVSVGSELAYELHRADVLVIVPCEASLDAGAEVECLVLAEDGAAPAASE
jgi:molybdopterin molybdotransferase